MSVPAEVEKDGFLFACLFGFERFLNHDADGVAGILGQTRLAHASMYVTQDTSFVATAICLCLMLGACGVDLGPPSEDFPPKEDDNPDGYGENVPMVRVNEAVLKALDGA